MGCGGEIAAWWDWKFDAQAPTDVEELTMMTMIVEAVAVV